MANTRDGSIRDKTVNESLQVGGDIFFIHHPETFDDNTVFTYIFPDDVEGNTITAEELKTANISNKIDEIDLGQVIDDQENIYFLQPLNGELVLLLNGSLKKDEINQSEGANTITLSPQAYLKFLNVYLNQLEEIYHIFDIFDNLLKESVQDAVDIVQTKRIEFKEIKDEKIDVTGIFLVFLISVFFEAGIATAIFSALAEKISSSAVFKKVITAFSHFVAGFSPKESNSIIKTAQNNISVLRKKLLSRERIDLIIENTNTKLRPDTQLDLLKFNQFVQVKILQEEEIIEDQEAIQNEFFKRGKEIIDKSLDTAKEVEFNAIATHTTIAAAEERDKVEKKETRNESEEKAAIDIPLDVYLKSYVQNLFYENVLFIKDLMVMMRTLQNDAITRNMDEETVKLHQEVFKKFPIVNINNALVSLRKLYNESFSYAIAKEAHTKEFEFLIWIMLIGDKTSEISAVPSSPEFDTSAFPQISDALKNAGIPVNNIILTVDDHIIEYLSKRFNIANDLRVMGPFIAAKFEEMKKIKGDINTKLKKEEDPLYKINIIKNGIEISDPNSKNLPNPTP